MKLVSIHLLILLALSGLGPLIRTVVNAMSGDSWMIIVALAFIVVIGFYLLSSRGRNGKN